jgi:putative nucleotidyltransferase with HDIG domain
MTLTPPSLDEADDEIADRLALASPPRGDGRYAGIRLNDVVGAMSHALDLAEGQPMGHSIRTAMIGMRIAAVLKLPEADSSALFYALLLKDLGCSSVSAAMSTLYEGDDRALKKAYRLIDWTDRYDRARYALRHSRASRSGVVRGWHALWGGGRIEAGRWAMAKVKSERGADIAAMLAMPVATCDAIRSIDEHWDGNGIPDGLKGAAIPLLSRIVCLAQTVEVYEHQFDVGAAFDVAHRRKGRWFDPDLVDCLDRFHDDALFWGRLQGVDALEQLAGVEPPERVVYADELRLDTVAEAFAKVIDAKSPFTARHSQNVAFLATRTAKELGLPRREIRAIRRAALLHDVGKLGVSNRVIDKPTALDHAETAEMRRHTVYTFEILRGVKRFERFAALAASHHERLDGSGYHLGLAGSDLGVLARILAAADVCEALSADRPYRAGMPLDQVMDVLATMADRGELCHAAVSGLTGWFHGLPSSPVESTEHGDSTSLVGI